MVPIQGKMTKKTKLETNKYMPARWFGSWFLAKWQTNIRRIGLLFCLVGRVGHYLLFSFSGVIGFGTWYLVPSLVGKQSRIGGGGWVGTYACLCFWYLSVWSELEERKGRLYTGAWFYWVRQLYYYFLVYFSCACFYFTGYQWVAIWANLHALCGM